MERFLTSAIHRPIAVTAVALVVLALGTTAVLRLPLSLEPDKDYPGLNIAVAWPGASSEAVVKHVTALIESEISSVPGIIEIRSETKEGMAGIYATFDHTLSIASARALLRDRLASLREELPDGVEPRISERTPQMFRDLEGFMSYRLSGPMTDFALRALAIEEILPVLSSLDGVRNVEVIGGREEELVLRLDADRLHSSGLTPSQVQIAINDTFKSHAAGAVHGKSTLIPLYTKPMSTVMEDLPELPVATGRDELIRLGDLVDSRMGLTKPRSISRLNGQSAISIEIDQQPGTNMLDVADRVRTRMDELARGLPAGVLANLVTDRSEDVRQALDDLFVRVAIALVAIIALLLVFIRQIRASIVLFSSIGLSMLAAMICFEAMGLGLDLLTISGLALAFGILVDNAVVIYENIRRCREEGDKPDAATVRGTSEMLIPVAATTMTTIAALVPIVYLSDEFRRDFAPFALGLGLTLAASIVVAGIWVPVVTHRLDRKVSSEHRPAYVMRFVGWYGRAVSRMVRWRWSVALSTFGIFGISVFLFTTDVWKGPSFGWFADETRISVQIGGHPGMETSTIDSVALAFERYAVEAGGKNVEVVTRIDGTNASMLTRFSEESALTALPLEMLGRMMNLVTHFGGLSIGVSGMGTGFSTGRGGAIPFNLKMVGYNYDDLRDHAERVARQLERNRRVRKVETTNSTMWSFGGGPYYELQFNPAQRTLARAGVNLGDLDELLRLYADREGHDGELHLDGRRIPFRVVVDRSASASDLGRLPIRNTDVTLDMGDAGYLAFNRVPTAIMRSDQQYERWISYEFVGAGRLAGRFQEAFLNAVELPPGYRIESRSWGGFDWGEERDLYLAVCLAFVLVLLVTSALFESFRRAAVALLTVPMGLTGIFLVFWIFELSFDRGAFLGTIFMVGIVVNNAILLVDRMARLQREGMLLDEAVITAARQRVRPILITSLTTLVGLTPLLFAGHPSTRDLWISLSYTGLSGLTLSTLLVLFVTPALYRLIAPGDRGKQA
ncbi:MAG: efflux RND transporter permease subunit [Gemmatimonadetes bacterium]|nr:efflux RND transporter permease subunit [Gemmatimonadota bacterium]MYG86463.1 efflux RND transporter permease subunit [Gemmatimonadota bacterium]MYJ89953.1 efflux RND transporter permease subunit [Gemmatimonadota bacterium]